MFEAASKLRAVPSVIISPVSVSVAEHARSNEIKISRYLIKFIFSYSACLYELSVQTLSYLHAHRRVQLTV